MVLGGLLGLTGVALAALAIAFSHNEADRRAQADSVARTQLALLRQELGELQSARSTLAGRLAATERKLASSEGGVAPLAARMLRSVFTVETPYGLGTAWAAWTADGSTFLITADHVAEDAIGNGTRSVTLRQKARSWKGVITRTDSINDLAVIRVKGEIAPPLWQTPDSSISPKPGDKLLLVGSPYGLEGTVTTGIVSRVRYDEVQTDAAANPGNSGGPAVDSAGTIVGVLVSGGGENLNFLVPIQRACVTVRRDCGG